MAMMTGLECAVWGLFGGFAVEGLEFAAAIRRTGTWPWRKEGEPGPLPLAISVVIRLAIGAGLAVAAGSTGHISGALGALAVGVAAPLMIEQLARQVPVTTGAEAEPPPQATPARPEMHPTGQGERG